VARAWTSLGFLLRTLSGAAASAIIDFISAAGVGCQLPILNIATNGRIVDPARRVF
jgi:hypothetical protein